ncbi:MAG: recombinase family protein [Acutalibacteraceae bacterium]
MKVWLYYRLSRDEDAELNSLNNQRNILVEYAKANNHDIVGESFDDNVSGMHFNREGINKIYEEVEKKSFDTILVKDMSRLGRHKTQTAMFIDYLRENDINVLSVTENLDTSNESDDLIIGFKGLFNDMYARDISKKVRAGMNQKLKDGMVLTPPMGYFKDKNTNEIIVVEEHAEIVRRIFDMYLNGYGLNSIAKILNQEGIKSPAFYQKKLFGKNLGYNKPEIGRRYLWDNTGVKRILQNEFYIGTVVNHKTYNNKITHVRKNIPENEQYRHEKIVPAIISKDKWEQVQFIMSDKVKRNVRAGSNKPCHRYAGLIKCGDCGSSFVCKTRNWRDFPERIEYVCNGYHRYGKENCSPHRINETLLDELIYKEILAVKDSAIENYNSIETDVKKWMKQKNNVGNKLQKLNNELEQRKKDQKDILLERIRDKEHSEIYSEMLEACENDIQQIKQEIESIKDYNTTIKKRKSEIKQTVDLIEEIVKDGAISNANLRLLVDEIKMYESDKRLKIEINLKANFAKHFEIYGESGEKHSLILQDLRK